MLEASSHLLQLSGLPLQVPTVTGIGQDAALLYEAESEEVVVARDTFASLRQYLVTLQDEVLSFFPFLLAGTPWYSEQIHNSSFHQGHSQLKQWVAVAAWPYMEKWLQRSHRVSSGQMTAPHNSA